MRFAERNGYRAVEAKLQGWPEHYFSRRTRAHLPGLVLTGEAFGIDPLLGEGIAPALEISRYAARRVKAALDAGEKTIRAYESGLLLTHEGANLAFQEILANRLYGPAAMRWMRVLFTNTTMHRVAASGRAAYGRLTGRAPQLALGFAWQVLTRGIPSAEPLAAEVS
jgi:flavin-dependent dehydrogenase